jgi:hypothetical protein
MSDLFRSGFASTKKPTAPVSTPDAGTARVTAGSDPSAARKAPDYGTGVPTKSAIDEETARSNAMFSRPVAEWTDAELNAFVPAIGSGADLLVQVTNEKQARSTRKDYLATTTDQPGRKQTVQTTRSPSVLGKPIL